MDHTLRPHADLVDLLDRVLDRGLVINADIIISLAGVPLVGIKLAAAIASIETMVNYGVLNRSDLQPQLQESRPPEALVAQVGTGAEGSIRRSMELPSLGLPSLHINQVRGK